MSSQWVGLKMVRSTPPNVKSIDEEELALRIPCSDGKGLFFNIDRLKKVYMSISNLPEPPDNINILDGPVIYRQGTAVGRCNICEEIGKNTTYIRFHQNASNNVETWIHEDCIETFLELIEEELEKHSDELVADYL